MYHSSFFFSSRCRSSCPCAISASNAAVCPLQRGVFMLLKQRLCGGIGRTWVIRALPAWCIQPTPHNMIREANHFFPTIPGGWKINPRHISAPGSPSPVSHVLVLYCTPSTVTFSDCIRRNMGSCLEEACWSDQRCGALCVLPSENLCHLMSR